MVFLVDGRLSTLLGHTPDDLTVRFAAGAAVGCGRFKWRFRPQPAVAPGPPKRPVALTMTGDSGALRSSAYANRA